MHTHLLVFLKLAFFAKKNFLFYETQKPLQFFTACFKNLVQKNLRKYVTKTYAVGN